MNDCQYFSFFGSVRTKKTSASLDIEAEINHKLGELSTDDCRDYQQACYQAAGIVLDDLASGNMVLHQQSDSTHAIVFKFRDTHILYVCNDFAGWIEWGEVMYPLEFDAPAAIAGACCNPRYGLE